MASAVRNMEEFIENLEGFTLGNKFNNLLNDIEGLLEHILLEKEFTDKDFEYCLKKYPEIVNKITSKKVFFKEEN